jgi:hypothetical protein
MSSFILMRYNALPAAAVRVYLFLSLLTTIVCRFGECRHPETARIARLTARYAE